MINCAIDIGSNTMRLIIAEVMGAKVIKTLVSLRNITRLGATDKLNNNSSISADASCSHTLSQESLDRSINTLVEYKAEMDKYPLDNVIAVATDAVRRATNKDILLNAAKEIGIDIDVISGEQEALYAMQGVLASLAKIPPSLLIYDVGGGSTEIIYTQGGTLKFSTSIPLGVVTIADEFGFDKPTTTAIHEEASASIASLLKPIENVLLSYASEVATPITLIGTTGAVTSLAALHMKVNEGSNSNEYSDNNKLINNCILTHQHLFEIENSLMRVNLNDRQKITGIDIGREDLYIPGVLILRELFNIVSTHNDLYSIETNSLVSTQGLREGLLIAPIS